MQHEITMTEPPVSENLPLDAIRNETVFTRYPIHRLEKHKGEDTLEVREKNALGDGQYATKWQVSYNTQYGAAGVLAYKLDTLVVNRRIDDARQKGMVPSLIRLASLREIAREVGANEANTTTVKKALYQNAAAFIVTQQTYTARDGTKETLDFASTRYAVIIAGKTLPDGRKADAVYIELQNNYRDLLNSVRTRPLDYDYLRTLPPGQQRLYELLSFEMYAAIKRQGGRAKLIYSEYCPRAPQKRYHQFKRMNMQMKALHAPHKASGYIAEIEYVPTTDSDGNVDWEIFYTPGPKAIAEYIQFNTRGTGQLEFELPEMRRQRRSEAPRPALPPAAKEIPAPQQAQPAPDPEQDALIAELVKYQIAPLRALELTREQPAAQIRRSLQLFEYKQKRGDTIRDSGALLADMIAKPEKYTPPQGMPDPEKEAARKAEKKAAQEAQEARTAQIALRLIEFTRQMEQEQPEAFDAFLAYVEEEQQRMAQMPEFKNRHPDLQSLLLASFNGEKGRLKHFLDYFSKESPLPELQIFIKETSVVAIKRAIDTRL